MKRAFKYRLWTNTNQERELAIALETHRRLYNTCLDFRDLAYCCFGATVNYYDCCRWFTVQRKINPYFQRLHVQSAQATMARLENSFSNFYRRVKEGSEKPGYPKFKGKDHFNSIEFPQHPKGARIKSGKLYVHGIGHIRIKMHRSIEGKIKTVRLKREAGKWFVVFSCELPDIPKIRTKLPSVGIDVGLKTFLTTSSGTFEPNPRYLKTTLPELRRRNRSVARKRRGGKNRRKAVHRLQKVHTRVKNQRREHHHQVACRLVLTFGLIVVESLNIQGMLRNHKLSRAISDAGWSGFLNILKYKAEKAGVRYEEVNPHGTTQQCSCCQKDVPKSLSVRWHDCPHCGLSLDRDHNAALNILGRGLARTGPVEVNVGHKVKRLPRSRRAFRVG